MPLLDHFAPTVDLKHSWETFHSRWANAIADMLDRRLPSRYFAAVNIHVGSNVEADIAEFQTPLVLESTNGSSEDEGGVAVQTWAPPAVTFSIPAFFPDDVEVRVYDTRDGATLVAAVELVSPGNKDRAETREAFTAKCSAYLQRGLGLMVVDLVTSRLANLHNELMERLGHGPETAFQPETVPYATAYRPKHEGDKNEIDVWLSSFAVGESLPLLPLALRGGLFVPLDLEATYMETRKRCRL